MGYQFSEPLFEQWAARIMGDSESCSLATGKVRLTDQRAVLGDVEGRRYKLAGVSATSVSFNMPVELVQGAT